MQNPQINTNLSQPMAILAGTALMSYFTHDAWWALSGCTFVIAAYFSLTNHAGLTDFFFVY